LFNDGPLCRLNEGYHFVGIDFKNLVLFFPNPNGEFSPVLIESCSEFGSDKVCCSSRVKKKCNRKFPAYTCAVTPTIPTTEELLKRAADVIRQSGEYLEDFNAAVEQLQKAREEFQADHPHFGTRYS